ncbi:unnamed protein product, partial [Mesorhabditis spiculigera]
MLLVSQKHNLSARFQSKETIKAAHIVMPSSVGFLIVYGINLAISVYYATASLYGGVRIQHGKKPITSVKPMASDEHIKGVLDMWNRTAKAKGNKWRKTMKQAVHDEKARAKQNTVVGRAVGYRATTAP